MLASDEHIGVSNEIEIAKGKYKLNKSLKGIFKAKKREIWLSKKL